MNKKTEKIIIKLADKIPITSLLLELYDKVIYAKFVTIFGIIQLSATWALSLTTNETHKLWGIEVNISETEEVLFSVIGTVLIIFGGLFWGLLYILSHQVTMREYDAADNLEETAEKQRAKARESKKPVEGNKK